MLTEILRSELTPLQLQAMENGHKLAQFFGSYDAIEMLRRAKLLDLVDRGEVTWLSVRRIENEMRGRRIQAGVESDLEFTEGDVDDPDPFKRAMAQRAALFDLPDVRVPSKRLDIEDQEINWKKFDVEFGRLSRTWTPDQREHVLMETNRRAYPLAVFNALSAEAQSNIRDSQRARRHYLLSRDRPDLAQLLNELFYLENGEVQLPSPGDQGTQMESIQQETLQR